MITQQMRLSKEHITSRCPFLINAESKPASSLKFRNDKFYYILKRTRVDIVGKVEAIHPGLICPSLQLVNYRLGASYYLGPVNGC